MTTWKAHSHAIAVLTVLTGLSGPGHAAPPAGVHDALEVRASGQHARAPAVAPGRAAQDGDQSAPAVRRGTDLLRRAHLHAQVGEEAKARIGQGRKLRHVIWHGSGAPVDGIGPSISTIARAGRHPGR